jgi:hypothetical protein
MSQKQSSRFLLTQSLISAWQWGLKLENGYDDFLKTLRREPIQQTKAMLDGIRFENCLNAVLDGAEIEPTHEWYEPITQLANELQGAQQQAALSKDVTIGGTDFVLYGKLDYLRGGVIYDTKYSKTYRVGKYLDSSQHPMYFALVQEAREFQYKICDGNYIYTETYRRDEVEPIERTIKHFMDFLDKMNLVSVFYENWKSKY